MRFAGLGSGLGIGNTTETETFVPEVETFSGCSEPRFGISGSSKTTAIAKKNQNLAIPFLRFFCPDDEFNEVRGCTVTFNTHS